MPGRLPEAIADFEAALRSDPDSVEAHISLGKALSLMPVRRSQAIAEYEAALRIKPDPQVRRTSLDYERDCSEHGAEPYRSPAKRPAGPGLRKLTVINCSSMAAHKLFCILALAATLVAADKSERHPTGTNWNIPLWDGGKVPLAKGDGPLDIPFLTVFLPPDGKRNGGSVIVAPGGSNIMLMYGAEGMDIAERYNDWGVTAFVLTYRLSPRYGQDARVLDAQRAVRLVRSRAAEFGLDPKRVGYIGFSAGSNLGRSFVDVAGLGDANAPDPVDRLSSRPDYLGLIYGPGSPPGGRGRGGANPPPARPESLKDFPPTFLMCAAGDTQNANNTAQLFIDLNRAGAVAEIHVYQKGHHGFGDGFASGTYSDWMGRLEHFLKQGGFIPGGKE